MLRWTNKESRRFYRASLQYDLFGELIILVEWGSLDTCRGNHMVIPCANLGEVKSKLRGIFQRRKKRNYQLFPSSQNIAPARHIHPAQVVTDNVPAVSQQSNPDSHRVCDRCVTDLFRSSVTDD